jgi:hypothetical protein
MRQNDHWRLICGIAVLLIEIQVRLVRAIARDPLIIHTTPQQRGQYVAPGSFGGDTVPESGGIPIERDTRRDQICSCRGPTKARWGQILGSGSPPHHPVNMTTTQVGDKLIAPESSTAEMLG